MKRNLKLLGAAGALVMLLAGCAYDPYYDGYGYNGGYGNYAAYAGYPDPYYGGAYAGYYDYGYPWYGYYGAPLGFGLGLGYYGYGYGRGFDRGRFARGGFERGGGFRGDPGRCSHRRREGRWRLPRRWRRCKERRVFRRRIKVRDRHPQVVNSKRAEKSGLSGRRNFDPRSPCRPCRRHATAARHRRRRFLLRTVGDHRFGGDQQAATEAAFCSAMRTTLVGSTMPASMNRHTSRSGRRSR